MQTQKMKYFMLLLFPCLMGCPPQDRMASEKMETMISKEKIDPTQYEMLSYVDLFENEKLLVNEKKSDLPGLCQSLFTAHAFNGHIVLSSKQQTIKTPFYNEVKQEINDCHFKYLQLQAADLYDKPYKNLSEKTQKTIQTMFPLELIYAWVE